MLIIASLYFFVKNRFIPYQPVPFFFTDLHKCDNRVFIFWMIAGCNKSEYQSETLFVLYNLFQNHGCIGTDIFDDIIRLTND